MARYQSGDFTRAHDEFTRLASIGNRDAQFNLGVMALRGQGVPVDHVQAAAWMALACQQGCNVPSWAEARDLVLTSLSDEEREAAGRRRDELVAGWSDAALLQAVSPQQKVARSGTGPLHAIASKVPSYPLEMARLGRFGSVTINFTVAQDGSARHFAVESATSPEFMGAALEAIRHFRFDPVIENGRALELPAVTQEFIFRLDGEALDRGRIEARLTKQRERAAQGGSKEAWEFGRTLEATASVVQLPDALGTPNSWYLRAALQGYAPAQFALGRNLLTGWGGIQDRARGLQWLRAAAEAGQPDAEYAVAIEFFDNARSARDRADGIGWLERAAKAGFGSAQLRLAWLLATDPDPAARNAGRAQATLAQVHGDYFDRMTLAETRAAVVAASGDFKSAEREAGAAREEALRLGQPVERASALLAAYHDGRLWTEEPWPAQQR